MSATNTLNLDKLIKQLEDINVVIDNIYKIYGSKDAGISAINRYISDKNNCYKKIIKTVNYKTYLEIKEKDVKNNELMKLYSDNRVVMTKRLKKKNIISFYIWKVIYKNEKIIKKILRRL